MPDMPHPQPAPDAPDIAALAAQVVTLAQSRLTADLRFLSSSLEQLRPMALPQLNALYAADGRTLYYSPKTVLRVFRAQQSAPTRALLHTTLHCLLGHPFQKQEKDNALWGLPATSLWKRSSGSWTSPPAPCPPTRGSGTGSSACRKLARR